MSGLYENLPFARGATYGAADNTVATWLEGREYIHEDKTYGTGHYVKVRICRNNSGGTLAGKRGAKFNLTAGTFFTDVAGYADVAGEHSHVIDDLLTGTVPSGDLFYVVIEGPCLATTDLGLGAAIAVGDFLHAQTAATTGATTAGRVYGAVFTGATAVLQGQIANVIGRAMSACTSGNTGASLLIHAGQF